METAAPANRADSGVEIAFEMRVVSDAVFDERLVRAATEATVAHAPIPRSAAHIAR